METRIVAVGNSHGLRIPKALLEQARLAPGDKVQIGVESGRLIVEGARAPREGWAERYAQIRREELDDLWGKVPVSESWGD